MVSTQIRARALTHGLQIARQQAGKLHRDRSEGHPAETAVNKAGHKPWTNAGKVQIFLFPVFFQMFQKSGSAALQMFFCSSFISAALVIHV